MQERGRPKLDAYVSKQFRNDDDDKHQADALFTLEHIVFWIIPDFLHEIQYARNVSVSRFALLNVRKMYLEKAANTHFDRRVLFSFFWHTTHSRVCETLARVCILLLYFLYIN